MTHEHDWIVFSTAVEDRCLMLGCACGAQATVDDPTEEEWAQAFTAPSHPYRWGGGKVRIRQLGKICLPYHK